MCRAKSLSDNLIRKDRKLNLLAPRFFLCGAYNRASYLEHLSSASGEKVVHSALPKLTLLALVWMFVSCIPAATSPNTSIPPVGQPPSNEGLTTPPVAQATALPTATNVPSTPTSFAITQPTPTFVAPTLVATGMPQPTPTPNAVPSPTQVAIVVVEGRTPEGDYFLGDANAKQTLTEYSDFL
jgi:hypothetical protein